MRSRGVGHGLTGTSAGPRAGKPPAEAATAQGVVKRASSPDRYVAVPGVTTRLSARTITSGFLNITDDWRTGAV